MEGYEIQDRNVECNRSAQSLGRGARSGLREGTWEVMRGRDGAQDWYRGVESGEGHQVWERSAGPEKRQAAQIGVHQVRGSDLGEGLRAQGRNIVQRGEKLRVLGSGTQDGALRGCGCALPGSDVVVIHVPANVPQDHIEDQQDSEEKQSHEDGLGHGRYHDLHGPAE